MKFEPNYITPDGVFEVQIDMDKLMYEFKRPENVYPVAKNRTCNTITVFNNNTHSLSIKSLYVDKQGRLYFKGKPSYYSNEVNNYFIDELVELVVEDE